MGLVDELLHGRPAVSPAEADEPWGLQNVADLVPYWFDGGVLHTRDFGAADSFGTVSGMPRGEMVVWSLDRRSLVLTIRSSADVGRSWGDPADRRAVVAGQARGPPEPVGRVAGARRR